MAKSGSGGGRDIAELLSVLPLYAGLTAEEQAEMASGLRRMTFSDGQELTRQGGRPDGAYFILDGKLQVVIKLPGGGETLIAEPGPGAMLGELALIRSSRRGATVRATGPVETLFADRRYFQAALAQLRPAALKVLHQLARILSERLRLLHGQIRSHVESEAQGTYFRAPPAMPADQSPPPDFPVRPFLPLLPCFRDFDDGDLDHLVTIADVETLPRGTSLRLEGDASPACHVVVRGAVLSGFLHRERLHQLNILGPGRFCAVGAVVEGTPSSTSYYCCENSTLLRFEATAFRDLLGGFDQMALRLLSAVNEHQALMVTRSGNHLTRLVGLSRLHQQFAAAADVGA